MMGANFVRAVYDGEVARYAVSVGEVIDALRPQPDEIST
jgi:hypothetical protein